MHCVFRINLMHSMNNSTEISRLQQKEQTYRHTDKVNLAHSPYEFLHHIPSIVIKFIKFHSKVAFLHFLEGQRNRPNRIVSLSGVSRNCCVWSHQVSFKQLVRLQKFKRSQRYAIYVTLFITKPETDVPLTGSVQWWDTRMTPSIARRNSSDK